jgi:O-antigen biosynthesis protein
MDISVVIVNYNVRYFLEQCLISVFQSGKDLAMEVFVVDNNSVDGSVEMVQEKFPHVKLIANEDNVGFSKANNQAIDMSVGRFVLLLNPDTVLENDTLQRVVKFMDDHPDAGGLGVKMLDGRGRFLPESKRGLPTPAVAFFKVFGLSSLFPKSKIFGKYHLGYLNEDKIHEVDVLSGAFMLLRKTTLEKTGYLDESFFMYGEDIDLSYRISQAGYKNYYYPDTRIIHYKGESTKKSSINYVFVFYHAMIIFAQKHYSQKNARVFSILINIAIYFRAFVAIAARFFRRLFLPLLDAALIYTGFLFIKDYWEHHVFMVETTYYPPVFMAAVVPAYILTWLLAVYVSGGYDKPVRLFQIVKGVGLGTIFILVIYALLPISLRFSRALILLGSVWTLVSMLTSRSLINLFLNKKFSIGTTTAKRALIVGDGPEAERITQMLRQSGNTSFIGLASAKSSKPHGDEYLGTLSQINEIIDIYQIDEVIFCAGNLASEVIIDQMAALNMQDVNFKIAPPESLFIIGSNSIDTFGDLFTININAINKAGNKRTKRLFDFLVALMMLVTLPVHFIFVQDKVGLIKNIASVLIGRKSWVGYHPSVVTGKLPALKRGVLFPGDAFTNRTFDNDTMHNLNKLYAKDYKLKNDIYILFKSYPRLGRTGR